MHSIVQTDVKISPWIVKLALSFIPKGLNEWYLNLNHFLKENQTMLGKFVLENQNFNYL